MASNNDLYGFGDSITFQQPNPDLMRTINARGPTVTQRPLPGGGTETTTHYDENNDGVPEYQTPANIEGKFPGAATATFTPIPGAKYKKVNPFRFGKRYGNFARNEILKNAELSRQLTNQQLEQELSSLQTYVPAASALKRQELSIDNIFNQYMRDRQIDQALPGVREELGGQRDRALSFASGRVPDEITDRALELGIRSSAADRAYAGGFGSRSSVARKASDLMSARERIGLSQYGDQLLTGNINTRANLFLAPTAYSDAGAQVRVMPSVSPAQLAQSNLSNINAQASIPATTAFTSQINQNQFGANLQQRTQEFNAANAFQASMFNAGQANQFALSKFQYQAGYENAVAGVANANIDRNDALAGFNSGMSDTASSINAGAAGEVAGIVGGIIQGVVGGLSNTGGGGASGSASGDPLGDLDFSPGQEAPEFDVGYDSSGPQGPSDLNFSPGDSAPSFDTGYNAVADTTIIPEDSLSFLKSLPIPQDYQVSLANFSRDAAVTLAPYFSGKNSAIALPLAKSLVNSGESMLNAVGVSSTPRPGLVQSGFDEAGKPIFAAPSLQTSSNLGDGTRMLDTTYQILAPFNVLQDQDILNMGQIASNITPENISRVDKAHQKGDFKTFLEELNMMAKPRRSKKKKKEK